MKKFSQMLHSFGIKNRIGVLSIEEKANTYHNDFGSFYLDSGVCRNGNSLYISHAPSSVTYDSVSISGGIKCKTYQFLFMLFLFYVG